MMLFKAKRKAQDKYAPPTLVWKPPKSSTTGSAPDPTSYRCAQSTPLARPKLAAKRTEPTTRSSNPNITRPKVHSAAPPSTLHQIIKHSSRSNLLTNVQNLLNRGLESVNATDSDGQTPLLYSIKQRPDDGTSLVDLINCLIKRGANLEASDSQGRRALHLVSERGLTEVARLLLNGGANVNCRDNEGMTPLHLASANFHVDVTRLLLDFGARSDLVNTQNETPAQKAAQRFWRDGLETLNAFISRVPNPSEQSVPANRHQETPNRLKRPVIVEEPEEDASSTPISSPSKQPRVEEPPEEETTPAASPYEDLTDDEEGEDAPVEEEPELIVVPRTEPAFSIDALLQRQQQGRAPNAPPPLFSMPTNRFTNARMMNFRSGPNGQTQPVVFVERQVPVFVPVAPNCTPRSYPMFNNFYGNASTRL